MIVVECFADELLIRRMGFGKKQICHAHSKARVLKKLKQFPKAIGIVDEDPGSGQPGEMKNYKVLKRLDTAVLMKKKDEKDTNFSKT